MVRVRVKPSILNGSVQAPPSKSYTHRAVILSSLCDGISRIENPLISGDTSATIKACKAIGAKIEGRENYLIISGVRQPEAPGDVIDAENSGTTIRFMTAVASLIHQGFTVLTGDESIRRRPMQPLLDTLQQLGVECWSTQLNGLPPIVVKGGGLKGGSAKIRGDVSSQFISAILITAPKAKEETHLKVLGRRVSKPYVEATSKMIQNFGGRVEMNGDGDYHIPPRQEYLPTRFRVPGDFSSASFILAGAALTGGEVIVEGLDFSLPQADMRILDILKQMNASVKVDKKGGSVMVKKEGVLEGGEFNLSDSPDLLPVVSILALKAKGRVMIKGVEHARFKESDRVAVLAEELRRFGAQVKELKDGLIISPSKDLKSCLVNAHGDHRMFMAFTLAGMVASKGCLIDGAESVQISYPGFIEHIQSLGGSIEVVEK